MARVKVYAVGDSVNYNSNGTEYRARIVETHATTAAFSGGYEYTIRIIGNRGLAYRSGDTFRTTAQFLTGKATTRKTRKPVSSRKRAQSRDMAKLKEMHKQLMS